MQMSLTCGGREEECEIRVGRVVAERRTFGCATSQSSSVCQNAIISAWVTIRMTCIPWRIVWASCVANVRCAPRESGLRTLWIRAEDGMFEL